MFGKKAQIDQIKMNKQTRNYQKSKKDNPNYGYRSMVAMLKKLGFVINKNKV